MSRSCYSDDGEFLELYRNAVDCAIKGRRGQRFLQKLGAALDAMPVKRLITDELVTKDGEVCALGCLGVADGLPLTGINPGAHGLLARIFNVAPSLIREVEFENDDHDDYVNWTDKMRTPERRWTRMREWVTSNLIEDKP